MVGRPSYEVSDDDVKNNDAASLHRYGRSVSSCAADVDFVDYYFVETKRGAAALSHPTILTRQSRRG